MPSPPCRRQAVATKEIASKARAILAKAYRDNGDLGAANYVEAGLDLTPDTQVHLLAIIDALANRPQPVEVPDDLAGLRGALAPFARLGELIDLETEGFADADELPLTTEDGYLLDRLTVGDFRRARTALNQEVR